MVYSYDVFETCLIRDLADPREIFRILGMEVVDQGTMQGFTAEEVCRLRIEAERQARIHSRTEEVTLDAIYRHLSNLVFVPEDGLAWVKKKELELEEKALKPNDSLLDEICVLRRKTESRIVFISDMYLPGAFIEDQLRRHGFYENGDSLFVSCEEGFQKRSGNLYKIAAKRLKVEADAIRHTGNDWSSDVERARGLGIEAVHYARGNLNRFEAYIFGNPEQRTDESSRISAVSRWTRLSVPSRAEPAMFRSEIFTSIAAPLIVLFNEWILNHCEAKGIKRCYFLARDGELLMKGWELKARQDESYRNIECRYLYGSRKAWLPIAFESLENLLPFLRVVFRESAFEQERFLAAVTGDKQVRRDPPMELLTVLGELEGWEITERLTEKMVHALRDQKLDEWILEENRNRQAEINAYFEKEGLFEEDTASGLVDTGWTGYWQELVRKSVRQRGLSPPEVYLLGRLNSRVAPAPGAGIQGYLFDHYRGFGERGAPQGIVRVIETLLPSDHGMTLGYSHRENAIEPVLGESAANAGVFEEYSRLLEIYIDRLGVSHSLRAASGYLRRRLYEAVDLLYGSVTLTEIKAFDGEVFNATTTGSDDAALAPSYRGLAPLRTFLGLPDLSPWPQGSWVQTGRGMKACIKLARIAKPLGVRFNKWGQKIRFRWMGLLIRLGFRN